MIWIPDARDPLGVCVGVVGLFVRHFLLHDPRHSRIHLALYLTQDFIPGFPCALNAFFILLVDIDVGQPPVQVRVGVSRAEAHRCGNDVEVMLAKPAYGLAGANVSPILEESVGLRAALGA